jgi:pSer/pThr/pTyr-binding forkhead associated (FHA) protein
MRTNFWLTIPGLDADRWSFRIPRGRLSVGRAPENGLQLAHLTVSRVHAEIVASAAQVVVHDLGSRHGTFVDGRRIRTATVQPGQVLGLGSVTLELRDGSELGLVADTTCIPRDRDRVLQLPPLPVNSLTKAQHRVLDVVLTGKSEKQIAQRLSLSLHTIHAHIKRIYIAFDVHSRAELLARCMTRRGDKAPT